MATGSISAFGPQGATGPQGPAMVPNFQMSFPGKDPSVVSETRLTDGMTLVMRANSTVTLESTVRISAVVSAFLKTGDKETFVAQMSNWEMYERPQNGLPSFRSSIEGSLSMREIRVPDDLDSLSRGAARAAMKMSSVLMAAVHLRYLREEDFTEAWRAAHVLDVMDT